MNFSKLNYPENEQNRLNELNELFTQWYKTAKNIPNQDSEIADRIVWDGFYPYFDNQKCKILFIGREAYGVEGSNYIDIIHDALKENKVANKHINQFAFYRRMFYLAYGLNNNCCDWEEIPYPTELTKDFATKDGLSYAIMNISKFSNESENWQADKNLINQFVTMFSDDNYNFFKKEIEIINPDIIFTMNLDNYLDVLGHMESIERTPNVNFYKYSLAEKTILLADTYHFSAIKKERTTFYDDIIAGIKKHSDLCS